MLQISLDLRAEADEFRALLETLDTADWSRPTPFMNWTPWDVVAHLHFFDNVSLQAATDADAFAATRDKFIADIRGGLSGTEQTRRALQQFDQVELLARWHKTCVELCEVLGTSDPKRRLPWFGPDMGVQMFTTARYMETWAHAQDVYDLLAAPRTHTDRIKNIATIGVKTFGWTYINRKLDIPGEPPHVRLTAPSGATWEWNETNTTDRVEGDAVEFCHVVTQGRNIADTRLEVHGDVAKSWMSIAQCFAGGPVDPPKPGERVGNRG